MAVTPNHSRLPRTIAWGEAQADGPVVALARRLGGAARHAVLVGAATHGWLWSAFFRLLGPRPPPARARRAKRSRMGSAGLIGQRVGRGARSFEEMRADFTAASLAADAGLHALAQALGDPDPAVRTAALDLVCEFSTDRAAPLLAGMIHDPDPAVRCAAAGAAARLALARTVSSLIVALDDPEAAVRAAG